MKNKVILVTSDVFGKGETELGETVMETFFTVLKQQLELPVAVFFMNRGVFCLTNQSMTSLHAKELQEKGVSVYACKTCVDYYGVENELTAGEISSMGHFVELAAKHEVITIS
ncbi:DsrE family protein [Fictibacillus iocasae]|uniref:DsrE family protein n=1 Tax=Fictibacillus iocasae TaxID=2715437 RepID=A0ABW2NW09_9BACL